MTSFLGWPTTNAMVIENAWREGLSAATGDNLVVGLRRGERCDSRGMLDKTGSELSTMQDDCLQLKCWCLASGFGGTC